MLKLAVHHLRTVVEAEPSNARAALALGDLLAVVDQEEKAVAVVAAAGKALLDILEAAGGVEYLEPATRVALGSAFRRLGGWHLRSQSSANGGKEYAKQLLRQAFFLDPEPMRRAAAEKRALQAKEQRREL
jgi:hypothetical protein